MANKGYVSEAMSAGRIVSHGKISSLTNGFSLKGNIPFSVYVRPKGESSAMDLVASVRGFQDDDFGNVPLELYCWSSILISEIAKNQNDLLTNYDIYWGAGSAVEK